MQLGNSGEGLLKFWLEGRVLGCLGVRLNSGEFGAKSRIGKSDEAEHARGAIIGAIIGALPNKLRGCVVFFAVLPRTCRLRHSHRLCINTTNRHIPSQSRIAGHHSGDLQGRSQAWQAKAGFAGFASIVDLVGRANRIDDRNKDIPSRIVGLIMGFNPGGWLNDAHCHFSSTSEAY
jgi:hypothetical protein